MSEMKQDISRDTKCNSIDHKDKDYDIQKDIVRVKEQLKTSSMEAA